jgi:hypothetical protein
MGKGSKVIMISTPTTTNQWWQAFSRSTRLYDHDLDYIKKLSIDDIKPLLVDIEYFTNHDVKSYLENIQLQLNREEALCEL